MAIHSAFTGDQSDGTDGADARGASAQKYSSRVRARLRFFLQRVVFRSLVNATITQRTVVDEQVKSLEGAYVLIANHSSHLDACLLAQGMPRAQARFLATGVAYDYFFRKWYKRWFVRWLFNAFPIDRDGSKKHSGKARRLLEQGVPVLVFPEGGRQSDGVLADFTVGAAKLAISTAVPIVPAAIVGGYDAMPKGRRWPVPGRPPVTLYVGAPLIPQPAESAAALTERALLAVQSLHRHGHHRA